MAKLDSKYNQPDRYALVLEEHQLLQEATPALKRFLAGVKAWLGGSNEWHRHSGRYQN